MLGSETIHNMILQRLRLQLMYFLNLDNLNLKPGYEISYLNLLELY